MWIVRLALRRPYTFVVLSILLLIMGPVTILRTPTDIFPNIDIPVVSVIWQYSGLSARQMASVSSILTERALSTTVNNIEHVESQSMNGIAVVKVFFQPHVGHQHCDRTGDGGLADPVAAACHRARLRR